MYGGGGAFEPLASDFETLTAPIYSLEFPVQYDYSGYPSSQLEGQYSAALTPESLTYEDQSSEHSAGNNSPSGDAFPYDFSSTGEFRAEERREGEQYSMAPLKEEGREGSFYPKAQAREIREEELYNVKEGVREGCSSYPPAGSNEGRDPLYIMGSHREGGSPYPLLQQNEGAEGELYREGGSPYPMIHHKEGREKEQYSMVLHKEGGSPYPIEPYKEVESSYNIVQNEEVGGSYPLAQNKKIGSTYPVVPQAQKDSREEPYGMVTQDTAQNSPPGVYKADQYPSPVVNIQHHHSTSIQYTIMPMAGYPGQGHYSMVKPEVDNIPGMAKEYPASNYIIPSIYQNQMNNSSSSFQNHNGHPHLSQPHMSQSQMSQSQMPQSQQPSSQYYQEPQEYKYSAHYEPGSIPYPSPPLEQSYPGYEHKYDPTDPAMQGYYMARQAIQPRKAKLSKWKEKVEKSREVCVVCGDKSSGWHYNVLACEGCKGFFRRSVAKTLQYSCKYGGACKIDMHMRKRCQACRLNKCYREGMKSECVESQSVAAQKAELKRKIEEDMLLKSQAMEASRRPPPPPPQVRPPSQVEQNLIEKLLHYQDQFEYPSEVQQQEIDLAISQERTVEDRMLAQLTQNSLATVKLLFEFTRRLPGFENFPNEDQVAMLKAGSSEIMLLRNARCYNPLNQTIVLFNKVAYDLKAYESVGLNNEDLFRFCHKVHKLAVDPTEFALLTALIMFTERQAIILKKQVLEYQAFYTEALVSYVYTSPNRSNPGVELAYLLSLLVDLTALVEGNTEHCLSSKMKSQKLPPLLAELWDIPPSGPPGPLRPVAGGAMGY